MIKNKRILITGANGFIGAHLTRALKEDNEVYGVVRNKRGYEKGVIYCEQDLTKELDFGILPEKVDVVVHLAASNSRGEDEKKDLKTNVLATYSMLEYAKKSGARLFLYSSSGNIYGYKDVPSKEEEDFAAMDFYGLTKYIGELLVRQYKRHFIPVILRIYHPYGPGQREEAVFSRLIRKIEESEIITVNNKKSPIMTPIYITDAINMMQNAMLLERGTILNIAGSKCYSVYEICEIIGDILSKSVKYIFENDESITGGVMGDITKARELLAYEPKVDLREGIKSLVASI